MSWESPRWNPYWKHTRLLTKRTRFESCPLRPPWRNVLLTCRGLLTRESESFGPFGTDTVPNSGISTRVPVFGFEPESPTAGRRDAHELPQTLWRVGGLATRMKKRRARERSAFRVNQRVAKVRSRLKGSPCQTLFVTTRARPEFRSREMVTCCRSSSPTRWLGGNQLSSNCSEQG